MVDAIISFNYNESGECAPGVVFRFCRWVFPCVAFRSLFRVELIWKPVCCVQRWHFVKPAVWVFRRQNVQTGFDSHHSLGNGSCSHEVHFYWKRKPRGQEIKATHTHTQSHTHNHTHTHTHTHTLTHRLTHKLAHTARALLSFDTRIVF